MKVNFFIILFVLLNLIRINVFARSNEEIRDKFNKIISQEKYDYETGRVKKEAPKEETGFMKIFYLVIAFILNIFKIIGKIFSSLWRTYPLFTFSVIVGLLSLVGFFIYWIAKQINISFDKKNKRLENTGSEELHFDYARELKIAKKLIEEKRFKEAISVLINALWLFYYHKKILKYDKSRTNREYLKFLMNMDNYESLKQLIFKAEKAVYYKETINEGECREILWGVSEIFSQ